VTAYDEHAIRAFDLHAVDYLLKPFDAPRFARALERAKEAVVRREAVEETRQLRQALSAVRADRDAPLERLLVEDGDRTLLLRLADVHQLESDRNHVTLRTATGAFRVRGTMAELEARLDRRRFARVSRGTIVNLDQVASLEPAGHGDYVVRLRNNRTVRLSRRYRDRLDAFRPGADGPPK